jgi:hypothetical protein
MGAVVVVFFSLTLPLLTALFRLELLGFAWL